LAEVLIADSRIAAPCTSTPSVMKAIVALALALTARPVIATELTQADWDSATAGKSVFVKFLAPW